MILASCAEWQCRLRPVLRFQLVISRSLLLAYTLSTSAAFRNRRKISLAEPIKKLGTYTVPVRLYHEVEGKIKLVVEKKPEPA